MTASKSASRPAVRRVVLTWLAATLLAVLLTLALGERIRRGLFDSWQAASPRMVEASDVRVVLVDNASIEAVGAWPWPRYYLARLTDELRDRGAEVIAFDMLFAEPDRVRPDLFVSFYPELSSGSAAEVSALQPMDTLFGTVIGRSPVILAHAGTDEAPAGSNAMVEPVVTGHMPPSLDSWPAELAAIPELDDVALGSGLVNAPPDSDGVIRSLPLVMRAGGKVRPSFALEIARTMVGADKVVAGPHAIRLGAHSIPIDHRGRARLHFGTFPPDKIVSAADVIGRSERLAPDLFKGKAVVIGLSADGTSDIAATPLAAEEYGPLIQAQAVDALLKGDVLRRPSWAAAAEWGLAALLALLALGNARFGRRYRLALAVAFIVVPLACWAAFANSGLLLDPARPLLVGGGALAGVAVGLFATARMDRERLRNALVHERIMAAETEGELQAARAIQLAMVPPRSRLASIDPRVDLDAILEPAKSVGGDFYDAMKIGDDLLGFAIADVTGKGVPAALFMAMSKALTSAALARTDIDVSAMASAVNEELLRDNSEAMSVTMLLGILDLRSGDVRLTCAGHEDPLLRSADGTVAPVRLDGGPPLSITEYPYPLEALRLELGQALVLVTDGVTEAQNGAGALFGRAGILAAADKDIASSRAVCDFIRDQVRAFEDGAEATDDLTVMTVRYLGNS